MLHGENESNRKTKESLTFFYNHLKIDQFIKKESFEKNRIA